MFTRKQLINANCSRLFDIECEQASILNGSQLNYFSVDDPDTVHALIGLKGTSTLSLFCAAYIYQL